LASDAVGGLTRGAASRIVPGSGLQASENLGGHLLAKHVARTEAQLMSRAMTDKMTKGLVSTFFDRATAEAAASQAIDANAGEIAKWLASGKATPLKIFDTMSKPVGKIITNEGVSIMSSHSVFVLVRDASSSEGYHVLTGYPTTY
jgi:filamentous hemagglutinin